MTNTPLSQLLNQRKLFLAFVRRRVFDPNLAEDILQTCYLRAFEHQGDFKPEESAVAWFYRLLRNAVIDSYRRHKSQDKALEAGTRELETSASPSPGLHDEVCACLHGIVERLKPEYSEALRAVDLGEQRVLDFAKLHNISPSNASVRVHRARAALSEAATANVRELCGTRLLELHVQNACVFCPLGRPYADRPYGIAIWPTEGSSGRVLGRAHLRQTHLYCICPTSP